MKIVPFKSRYVMYLRNVSCVAVNGRFGGNKRLRRSLQVANASHAGPQPQGICLTRMSDIRPSHE